MARRDVFVDHLAQVPLFSACSRKDLELVARRVEDVKVDAGTQLASEGQAGDQFFVIVEGQATVSRHGQKVAELGPGHFFGELALLDRAPRNASVIADTPMELIVMTQREFAGLIDDIPEFAHKLLTGLARRLRDADSQTVH
jgi:CRP/FNR family cyclic AMP-dependent transcriptional regulator